jgi:hypothetical protein
MTRPFARAVVLAAAALVAAGCAALGLHPREAAFSLADMQSRLEKRFPWKKTFLGVIELELTNPKLALAPDRNRIAVAFDTATRSPLANRPFLGRATLSGVPRYEPNERAFYLAEPRFDALELEGVPSGIAAELRRIADGIAADALAGVPLHTLKPEDTRYYGTEMTARAIRVERDRVVVELQPKQ